MFKKAPLGDSMKIAENLLQLIGNTPLVKINKLGTGNANLFAKLEEFNPGGCVKERIALAMVETAEKSGALKPGATIIEPTSGNTGIGLALVAAVKNYKLILTMPETMSVERRKMLAAYGAELVLTPGPLGMKGAIAKATELSQKVPGSFIPAQFDNPANPQVHFDTTGLEIWNDTDGKVDVVVCGVGTGGTLTGVGKKLKSLKKSVEMIAVEPSASPVLSGGSAGPHKIQGIGAGFVPSVLDRTVIDKIIPVKDGDAGAIAKRLVREEGILCGISCGAAMWAALELEKLPEYKNKNIVVILPDSGDRYLSTWLFDLES